MNPNERLHFLKECYYAALASGAIHDIWCRVMSEGTMLIRSSAATANPTPACPFPYGVTVRPTSHPPLSSSAPPDAFSGTLASYKYKKHDVNLIAKTVRVIRKYK